MKPSLKVFGKTRDKITSTGVIGIQYQSVRIRLVYSYYLACCSQNIQCTCTVRDAHIGESDPDSRIILDLQGVNPGRLDGGELGNSTLCALFPTPTSTGGWYISMLCAFFLVLSSVGG